MAGFSPCLALFQEVAGKPGGLDGVCVSGGTNCQEQRHPTELTPLMSEKGQLGGIWPYYSMQGN